jgi:hypothetical protein
MKKLRDLDGSIRMDLHLVYKLLMSKGGPYIWSRCMKGDLEEHWKAKFFSNFPLMLEYIGIKMDSRYCNSFEFFFNFLICNKFVILLFLKFVQYFFKVQKVLVKGAHDHLLASLSTS